MPPAGPGDEPQAGMSVAQALRSPQFIILLLTNFFCCATHSGPIFHTVSYALTCGIPMIAAVTIYSVEGLAGMGGRVAFGLLGDRLGAKHVLVGGLLLQAFAVLAYVFVSQLAWFYAVAVLTGFVYAGVMPLYAVLARENFPLRMMGTIIGGTAMAGSLGMAIGPLAGGLIYDSLASYAWLYIGAFIMGVGAFLIAMTFRPFPTARPEPAPVRRVGGKRRAPAGRPASEELAALRAAGLLAGGDADDAGVTAGRAGEIGRLHGRHLLDGAALGEERGDHRVGVGALVGLARLVLPRHGSSERHVSAFHPYWVSGRAFSTFPRRDHGGMQFLFSSAIPRSRAIGPLPQGRAVAEKAGNDRKKKPPDQAHIRIPVRPSIDASSRQS